MFRLDRWEEIFVTIRKNKLRTALTAFSVAWGIFMLVILLGMGTGLQNQVEYQFRDDASNSLWIRPGETSKSFQGLAAIRRIQFTNEDYEALKEVVPEIIQMTARYYPPGNPLVSYKENARPFDIRACHPGHLYIENTLMKRGRFINDLDVRDRRKVSAIGTLVADFLFGEEDPIGKSISIGGIEYTIVGIFEDSGGEGEMQKVYIPVSTGQRAYGGGDRLNQIMIQIPDTTSLEKSIEIENRVRAFFARRHRFDIEDPRPVPINNNLERFQQVTGTFDAIRLMIWIVGIGTIIAGIVGISNIMLITVKERTKEIGVRKAIGATPGSIVGQILQESIFITLVAGYLGLIVGVGIIETVAALVPENDVIRDPQVDFGLAVSATVLLVIAGGFAGLFPALKAARVSPMEALREQ